MFTRSTAVRCLAVTLVVAFAALALAPRTCEAFTFTKYAGTYVLKDGRAGDISIQIAHATPGGWEGHATIECKGCESVATASAGWTITIYALDRNFEKRPIATLVGTLSADGRTLSGPFTKDGTGGLAILTAEE